MAIDFGPPEKGGISPVPLARLDPLFRSHPAELLRLIGAMPEVDRIRLAAWAFTRGPHHRDVALAIAATCDEQRLGATAGLIGMVLAARSREAPSAMAAPAAYARAG